MNFELIESGWDKRIDLAVSLGCSELRIVCPFIKKSVAGRLIAGRHAQSIQVITRFKLGDFCGGVSDTSALRLFLKRGAKIRGVQGLHAKVYLFGDKQVIVTSANLTDAGLSRNHEFGFATDDPIIIQRCRKYFDDLWQRVEPNLTTAKIDDWDNRLEKAKASGGRPRTVNKLPDFGVKLGADSSPLLESPVLNEEAPRSLVKIFGLSTDRRDQTESILEWVKESGCYWKCAYSKAKRPSAKAVNDGDIVFMGWQVKNDNDIRIFGRAIAMRHQPGRDDATEADFERGQIKREWPCLVRVHNAEFVSGTFQNGLSLYQLMDELKSNSFVTTQENKAKGEGNTNPRLSLNEQPQVRLSSQGYHWLNQKLEQAFRVYGKIPQTELANLYWPNNLA